MASDVNIQISRPTAEAPDAIERVKKIFADVERHCTRFDPKSTLMRINENPDAWLEVNDVCATVIKEAYLAYQETGGLFDPRMYKVLVESGYSASMEFGYGGESETTQAPSSKSIIEKSLWSPSFDEEKIRIGPDPIDLGGIGKGFAVRLAAAELRSSGNGFLIDAGGDIATSGLSDEDASWKIGIEDPWAPEGDPVAILETFKSGIATSSTRNRTWKFRGEKVHHLIDPRTRRPGGLGLTAVTIIADDPMWAEVWSKTLFLYGKETIEEESNARAMKALWIADDGTVGMSDWMRDNCIWVRT